MPTNFEPILKLAIYGNGTKKLDISCLLLMLINLVIESGETPPL